MSTPILMPALSPTMEAGTLAKWHVKEGDQVSSGDVIAEIETDKATMEVEAVDEGVLAKILVAEGAENVAVNTPIAMLAEEGEDASAVAAPAASASASESAQTPAAPAAPGAPAASASASPAPASAPAGGEDRAAASPLARRLASEAGLDVGVIAGTGPHGRVVKRDVEAALANGAAPASASRREREPSSGPAAEPVPAATARPAAPQALVATAPSAAPAPSRPDARTPEQMGIPAGSYDLVPLDGMRKTIARRMTESFRDVPHFPLNMNIRLDPLLALRKRLNERAADDGVKVSVNDFVIRAAALALRKVPEANATYTPSGLLMHHHADIAVAVAIDGGLITPIIRRAETKGLAQIALEMKDLATRARERKLMPEEYTGGTFSISNLGMFGVTSFASILNEPHGAIMSVGAGEQRPVAEDGALTIATVMSVTLTCDHRVVDGAIGARFLAAFKGLFEDPELMLL